jgi:hypothetical protein
MEIRLMKPSRTASPDATKPARVPHPDRASRHPRPEEGPALRVAGEAQIPAPAAASLEPAGSTPSSFSLAFDVKDAARAVAWLHLVRNDTDDLIALAREGARRPRHRVLARAEIRRQTREAALRVHGLLAEAEAALVPCPDVQPAPKPA